MFQQGHIDECSFIYIYCTMIYNSGELDNYLCTPTHWSVVVLSPINDACFLFVCLFVCFLLLLLLLLVKVTLQKTCMIHRTENYHRPLCRSVSYLGLSIIALYENRLMG